MRDAPFDVLNKKNPSVPHNWSTNVRSNEQKGDPKLTQEPSTNRRLRF